VVVDREPVRASFFLRRKKVKKRGICQGVVKTFCNKKNNQKMLSADCQALIVVYENLKRAYDMCFPAEYCEDLAHYELKYPETDYREIFLFKSLQAFVVSRKSKDHFENTVSAMGETYNMQFEKAFEIAKTAMKKDLVIANAALKLAKNQK